MKVQARDRLPKVPTGEIDQDSGLAGVYVVKRGVWHVGSLSGEQELIAWALGRPAALLEYGITYLSGTFSNVDGAGVTFNFGSLLSNTVEAREYVRASGHDLREFKLVEASARYDLPSDSDGELVDFIPEDFEWTLPPGG